MSSTTHRPTLASLLQEHRELLAEIDGLRAWWRETGELGQPRFGEMGERVAHLRTRLAEHFAFEEQGGYLAELLETAPNVAARAASLEHQHPALLHALEDLAERLREEPPRFESWSEARMVFEQFVHRFHDHEHAEHELIQTYLATDIGTGD